MLRLIERKVNDILADPYRFKPLRKPMQNKRRVHVGVLLSCSMKYANENNL